MRSLKSTVLRSAIALAVAALVPNAVFASGGPGGGGGGAGGGGGGGGGSGQMQIATQHGLYVIDLPQPGEASMTGFVLAELSGTFMTPADTVVTVNGVQLIHAPGLAPAWFVVDPNGPQPAVGADGFLHLSASSASTGTSRVLDLQCPARVVVATSPAPGASLTGAATLDMAWTKLPQNNSLFVTGSFSMDPPAAMLAQYDLATGAIVGPVGMNVLSQASLSTSIAVLPTAASGYVSELRYPGIYKLDGNSGGYCGRAQRYTYLQ